MPRLTRTFFERDTVQVAQDLLGQILVHEVDGQRLSGIVVETEAYTGFEDAASHAHRGKTDRNAVMFGPAGVSYVYLIYGMYWLLNVIAKPLDVDYPAAVLIRALEPLDGWDAIQHNRPGRPPKDWTSGPGRLTRALGIDRAHHGLDMISTQSSLYFEEGQSASDISTGPRIGLGKSVLEPWFSKDWRFWMTNNEFVSR